MKRLIRRWLGVDAAEAKANHLAGRVAQLELALKQANERAEVLACEVEAMDWRVPRAPHARFVREKLVDVGFDLIPF
jgi:hypothetical protein